MCGKASFGDALRNSDEDRDNNGEPSIRFFAAIYDEGCVSDDEEIALEKEDPLCSYIVLTKAEKIRLRSPWRKTLIIKVMGKSVGYNFLLRHIRMLWRPMEEIELVAMDNDYFFVKFESMLDHIMRSLRGHRLCLSTI